MKSNGLIISVFRILQKIQHNERRHSRRGFVWPSNKKCKNLLKAILWFRERTLSLSLCRSISFLFVSCFFFLWALPILTQLFPSIFSLRFILLLSKGHFCTRLAYSNTKQSFLTWFLKNNNAKTEGWYQWHTHGLEKNIYTLLIDPHVKEASDCISTPPQFFAALKRWQGNVYYLCFQRLPIESL